MASEPGELKRSNLRGRKSRRSFPEPDPYSNRWAEEAVSSQEVLEPADVVQSSLRKLRHGLSIVHLDIKPDNILLSRGEPGVAQSLRRQQVAIAGTARDSRLFQNRRPRIGSSCDRPKQHACSDPRFRMPVLQGARCDDITEGDCRYLAKEVLQGSLQIGRSYLKSPLRCAVQATLQIFLKQMCFSLGLAAISAKLQAFRSHLVALDVTTRPSSRFVHCWMLSGKVHCAPASTIARILEH